MDHLAKLKIIKKSELRSFDFGWIKLSDHFISTVGPSSGSGEPHGNLLVIADAELGAGSSFPLHSHSNMEILTWVAKGTLHHKDNQADDQFVEEHGLQLMSARNGISHAEGNSSPVPLRLLQIWIQPSKRLVGDAVVEKTKLEGKGFQLLAGKSEAPLLIEQDVSLWAAVVDGEMLKFEIQKQTSAYAVSIGQLNWNGNELEDGSGIFISDGIVEVKGSGQAIIIVQS